MASSCPFASSVSSTVGCPKNVDDKYSKNQVEGNEKIDVKENDPVIPAKCPYGFDSQTFKLGPLSCIICQALLFDSSRCLPCSHKFCRACISRFKDCPLCGADIESIESDEDLQILVDRFIDGHARIKRSQVTADAEAAEVEPKNVIYGDVSMERGSFLVQQAVRAFRAQNVESARSRLGICAEDIHEQMKTSTNTLELSSQLGAVLGMLGDCCKAMGDSASAIKNYEESVECLLKLPTKDFELVHTLSVSLNKIGDLKYYDGDLRSARSFYDRCLDVRRGAVKENPDISSQVVDLAVSLAKVADVNRSLGDEDAAFSGFLEAIACLENLKLDTKEAALEQRCRSVLEFVKDQMQDKPGNQQVGAAAVSSGI